MDMEYNSWESSTGHLAIPDYPYGELKWVGEEYIGIPERKVSIYKAYDPSTGKFYLIKRIPRGRCVDKYVDREVMNRRLLYHPNIVTMERILETETTLDIVLNCESGVSLASFAAEHGSFDEDRARMFFQQIMMSIDYCHCRKVCVRGVCLDNFVLDAERNSLQLLHLTTSVDTSFSLPITLIGRCDYLAPEIVRSNGATEYRPFPVDVWAAGVCLYVLLFYSYPFSSHSFEHNNRRLVDTYERILSGDFYLPKKQLLVETGCQEVEISEECLDLLRRMLEPEPSKRITVPEIFSHPWFLRNFDYEAWTANRFRQHPDNDPTNASTFRDIINRCRSFLRSVLHPYG